MNKTAIRTFAIWARVQLIESAKQRAYEYGITADGYGEYNSVSVGGRLLSESEQKQRRQLIDEIREKGFEQVMEEVAYTWFNRFIALRFMEVNNYLPSRVRIFTDETGAFKPEILKQAMSVEIEGLDRAKVLDLLDRQDNEELYKYLVISQCNALNSGLPGMFETISNWTELLFPANLLREGSVVEQMVKNIPESDWTDQVQIIGWLYQYYISEKHDAVINVLGGKAVKKEDIPAATQLFTTEWVVQYILDNSLGRYWIERHPESRLAEKLPYFVLPKDGKLPTVQESVSPETLRVFDPCVGSGQFLCYAFDVLLEIYRECGWSDRDAAKSILENNLYGLDIDERAAQLACFSVTEKAQKYNRRILRGNARPHIMAIQESKDISDALFAFVAEHDPILREDLSELRILFTNAKEYGSMISVPEMDFRRLRARIEEIQNRVFDNLEDISLQNAAVEKIPPLIEQAEILAGKYEVVSTNPPYMNKYSTRLKDFITQHYSDYKGDLFSVFMFRNFAFCKPNGYCGFMTPMVWMFIKTYEPLRNYIIGEKTITTLIQFEYSAYEEATVPICTFVLQNGKGNCKSLCFRLSDFRGGMQVQKEKVLDALKNPNCGYFYEAEQSNFSKIPGSPVAYWVSDSFIKIFENGTLLGKIADSKQGLATGCNDIFVRQWFEVVFSNINYNAKDCESSYLSAQKWFPYNKGGEFRKWYGNNDYVVNWENDGALIRNFKDEKGKLRSRPQNTNYYFKKCFSWSLVSSGIAAFRYKPNGHIFDIAGMSCFSNNHLYYLLGLCNSKVVMKILEVIAPTINYQCGDIANIPVIFKDDTIDDVELIVEQNIALSRDDWDSFETSWDFKRHPMI